jgi:Ca2+-binding EF-hand superfamily protein
MSNADHLTDSSVPAKSQDTATLALQKWFQDQLKPGTNDNGVYKNSLKPEARDTSDSNVQSQDVSKILNNFSIQDTSKNAADKHVQLDFDDLLKQVNPSSDTAVLITVNKLANDKGLATKLTGASGEISRDNAIEVMRAYIATTQGDHRSAPTLTKAQQETVVTFLEHNKQTGDIAIGALKGFSNAELTKTLNDKPIDKALVRNLAEQFEKANAEAKAKTQTSHTVVDKTSQEKAKEAARAEAAAQDAKAPVPHFTTTTTPQLNAKDFSQEAQIVLAKIDTAHNGYVTKEQLAQAMQNPAFTGQEAQALAAMYQNFDKLHNLSGDEGLFRISAISVNDLNKFQTVQAQQNQIVSDAITMKYWTQTNLPKFAHNGQHLSSADVEKALKTPNLSSEDRDALQLIQKNYKNIGSWTEWNGVTAKDFADYYTTSWNGSEQAKLVNEVATDIQRTATEAQTAGRCTDLYATQNPLESITPDAIKQGRIGDCYFEASLAAIAKTNPELIKNSIKDNHDGTYTVTFPGDPNSKITVSAPTEAEIGLYNSSGKNGIWSSIMEKAFGQYKGDHKHCWQSTNGTPESNADGGGYATDVLKLLTGSDVNSITLNDSPAKKAEVARELEAAFASNPPKAVASAIYGDSNFDQWFRNLPETTQANFYKSHEYTITGFTPDGHGGGTVTIRNPWGGDANTPEGTISIPLDVYLKNFSDINIQK